MHSAASALPPTPPSSRRAAWRRRPGAPQDAVGVVALSLPGGRAVERPVAEVAGGHGRDGLLRGGRVLRTGARVCSAVRWQRCGQLAGARPCRQGRGADLDDLGLGAHLVEHQALQSRKLVLVLMQRVAETLPSMHAMPPSSVGSPSTLHRQSSHLVVGALQPVRPDVLCPLRQRADAQHHMAGLHPPRSPLTLHQAGKPLMGWRTPSVSQLLCHAIVTGRGSGVRLRALPATGPVECSVPAGGGSAEWRP